MSSLPHKRTLFAHLTDDELTDAILERRYALRYDRDQLGDDRCWMYRYTIFKFLIWTPPIPIVPPSREEAMRECKLFYYFCREDGPPLALENAILDPTQWDNDIRFATRDRLLDFLEEIQLAIHAFLEICNRPRTVYDYRALYAVLPEPICADFRLPPEEDFLGRAKPGAGCPQFWDSHDACESQCDLNRWGPCRTK